MKRGEIYWADLAPLSGSEQQGRRPVVVIPHDAFNQTQGWRSVSVIPLSTCVAQTGRRPSAVLLRQGAAGLSQDSVALCHQELRISVLAWKGKLRRLSTLGSHSYMLHLWCAGREGFAICVSGRFRVLLATAARN